MGMEVTEVLSPILTLLGVFYLKIGLFFASWTFLVAVLNFYLQQQAQKKMKA